MQVYKGVAALSSFRARKLLSDLKAIDKSISDVTAEYIHFVNSAKKISGDQEAKLKQLLTYDTQFAGQSTGNLLLVVPRFGTVSSWSSKATDIAHNSGLKEIDSIERGVAYYIKSTNNINKVKIAALLHDRMTETVLSSINQASKLFEHTRPKTFKTIDVLKSGKPELIKANAKLGLALAEDEIDYLYDSYRQMKRNPTDVEIMMFGAVNSEHCRHKVFNADWIIDGQKQPKSLFKMIKNTHEQSGDNVLSAYKDNAAVIKGHDASFFMTNSKSNIYSYKKEPVHIVAKVETHNHPTAIAPFPGAATGIGGEIRDESATGRGAKFKIGLTGYSVSNLNLPGALRPWEKPLNKPDRIVSAVDIMVEAPIGGAAYANEFGRPNVAGYFRTYEQADHINYNWGYHKPIMIAGGLGSIRTSQVKKQKIPVGAKIIVLGGPSMLIGFGGGAASSMQTGQSEADLDFASVQRANAELERRTQEVINACWSMDSANPILSIHDVGAGGLSNALPELVHDADLGAKFELRQIPNAEPGMAPMEIWSNEAQERFVLAIDAMDLPLFEKLCQRERAPFAVVGTTTKKKQLILSDSRFNNRPVDIPMDVLFGKPPKMVREVTRTRTSQPDLETTDIKLGDAVKRVLMLPAVGSKKFLITIGDRNVGGLTARDQMVGPWQVPVSDVAVSSSSFDSQTGEAMAMGERTPLALIDGPASARMSIGETITNMAAADIRQLSDIKLSANWMAAVGYKSEDEKLFDTVKAVGEDFCPALGITIPVGKDSLSMRTVWQKNGKQQSVTSPVSLIISGFAPVNNVNKTLTPELVKNEPTNLILIDLGQGQNRLGGSALAQVYNQIGNQTPDIEPKLLKKFFAAIKYLKSKNLLLAYHDRSDGGLLTTLAEMSFASRCGLDIDIRRLPGGDLDKLLNEELGAVIQVKSSQSKEVTNFLNRVLGNCAYVIGQPTKQQNVKIKSGKKIIYKNTRSQLEQWWADTSYRIQALRDNPACALEEFKAIKDDKDPGLSAKVNFTLAKSKYKTRPKVAVLREQGVNGQVEMAAAFDKAGFTSVDVHLNDLMTGSISLDGFTGLVACGGFSYGDVLGAGEGWAKSILFNQDLRREFKHFFERPDTFSLGVCNGCQMLSALKELIPGAQDWPAFLKNTSEQFEARLVRVAINNSPSIFFKNMSNALLPIPVAHGEGRAVFEDSKTIKQMFKENLIVGQYVDNHGKITQAYPFNPNGSQLGITALTTSDGRATIMMPHPERAFLTKQYSWRPKEWGNDAPWFKMFQNARAWVEKS